VAQVALEAGNSPQMIFQHYRELVRPEAAKAWFAIKPKSGKRKAESGKSVPDGGIFGGSPVPPRQIKAEG
jgi:hypothetical protein